MLNLFNPRQMAWTTPAGATYNLFRDMLRQPHLLIAGATGSGKSVLENGLIVTALYDSPARVNFIMVDPKRVELVRYRSLPHVIRYASEPADMVTALQSALNITEQRYREMQRRRMTRYAGGPEIYVIIDELAALMTTAKKAVLPILQRLGMIARAAGVHMIACTQTVKADVLPTTLTCNFDSRVALRTSTAQQSRMIIDRPGCELFPSPTVSGRAQCAYRTGADLTIWNVPYVTEAEADRLIAWWTDKRHRSRF